MAKSHVAIRTSGDQTLILLRARPAGTVAALSTLLLLLLAGGWWLFVGWLRNDLGSIFRYPGDRADALGTDMALALILLVGTYLSARTAVRAILHHEVVALGPATLTLQRAALLPSGSRQFGYEYIHRLRAVPEASVVREEGLADPWGSDSGRNLAFDYGPRTLRFGLRLGEADAQEVVAAIAQRERIPEAPFSYDGFSHEAAGHDPLAPPAPRARVQLDEQTLRVTIPALKSWLLGALCLLALAFAIGEVALMLFDPEVGFISLRLLWFCAVVLIVVGRRLLWNAFGKEELLLSQDGALTLIHRYGLWRQRRPWRAQDVGRVAVSLLRASALGGDALPERGSIVLETLEGRQFVPHRFGVGLDEAEAEALALLLRERLDQVRGSVFESKSV